MEALQSASAAQVARTAILVERYYNEALSIAKLRGALTCTSSGAGPLCTGRSEALTFRQQIESVKK